jgi:broad specificity phosphatase PhoE
MKTAVVLRHAERQDKLDNASHLSEAGIAQARAAGSAFERFHMVVTSPLPRAVETAVAMGFPVHTTHPGIQEIGVRVMAHVRWSDGYAAWATAYREVPLVAAYIDYVMSLLGDWLDDVPDGGSLLVVAHGGIVESFAAGLCPAGDWSPPDGGAGYAEGFLALIAPGLAPQLSAVTAGAARE